MRKNICLILLTVAFISSTNLSAQEYKSGDADIDRVRLEVKAEKSNEANYRERTKILYMWMGALQQQGANTFPFFDLDLQYRRLETRIFNPLRFTQALTLHDERQSLADDKTSRAYLEAVAQICQTIDESFELMEEIQKELIEEGPMYTAFEGETEVTGGDLSAEWPMFQANIHNTGATDAPGPSYGREKWRFPVGLGWYARPVIEGDKVYVTSPGMRTSSFCLDLKTGNEIWKSTQNAPIFYLYKYPGMASTPLLINDHVVLREINSHGGNDGQARNLAYLNKESGELEERRYAGHIDYRTRYAPVTGNEDYVVYPFGVHDIYNTPAICQNLNRLICADSRNERKLWDFNVGDIDALAEPVISGDRVYQGTMEAYVYALNLADGSIAWKYKANGSVNSAVKVGAGKVFFGANGGSIYCMNEDDGKLEWEFKVEDPQEGARKHFTTPVLFDGQVYVGGADKYLYCLDAGTGEEKWKLEADDWIRSSPLVDDQNIHFATISGRLIQGKPQRTASVGWKNQRPCHLC